MKNKVIYILVVSSLFSCKKEEKILYPDGKPKYINTYEKDFVRINRFDKEGNLLFRGKYKDRQMIDTIFIYTKEDNYFVKVDSSDYKYFYGTYISNYSTGKNLKTSHLRFKKGNDFDSIIGSSLLFGKESLYNPQGKLTRETHYKINGDSSFVVSEENYDSIKKE